MSDINPYQSPEYGGVDAELKPPGPIVGVWRQGNLLVMHKQAELPDRCVMTNEPAGGVRFQRAYSWHHPLLFLAILTLIGYLVLLPIFGHSAVVQLPMGATWHANRRRRVRTGWTLGIAAIGMFVAGIALIPLGWIPSNMGTAVVVVPLLVFVTGAMIESSATRMPTVRRITKDYIWLKGVHPDFLAELPEWPYGI